MTRAAPLLFLLLLFGAGCARLRVRPYDGFLRGTDPDKTTVFLVRDKRTGRPIEGVVVRRHREWALTDDGRWAPLVTTARTDQYGLVSFPLPEHPGPCHWTFHARGYAPDQEYGDGLQTEVELERGWEQAGRLLAPTGEPLAGAEVEIKRGCAHAPALRTTRTDQDGVFVFENVLDGDITFEGRGFEADYWGGVRARPRRWGIATYQTLPGATLRGRMLDADGRPPAWAVVQSHTSSRGPRTVAGPDGRFVLHGVDPARDVFVHLEDRVLTIEGGTYRPNGPVVFPPREDPDGDLDGDRLHDLLVAVVGPDGEPHEEEGTIFLDRVTDGKRWTVRLGSYDPEFLVPPGPYVLSVGEPASRWVADARTLDVTGPTSIAVTVRRQPTLDVDVPGWEGDPIRDARVLLEDRHWRVDLRGPVHLPAGAPAWLRIDVGRVPFTFPIGDERNGRRRVTAMLPGLKRLVFPGLRGPYEVHFLYSEHEEVAADWEDSGEVRTLHTYATGRRRIIVRHPERGHATTHVDLPWRASGPIEVRGLSFTRPEPKTLRVLGPDGKPAGAWVTVLDDPSPPGVRLHALQHLEPDANGVFRHPLFRAGTRVKVEVEGLVPLWTRLRGEPPFAVRLGSATVEVDLRGLPDPSLVLDGWSRPPWGNEEPIVVLRGVTAGAHTLLVGARGRIGRAYRLQLEKGETRRIRPQLTLRNKENHK